jgi:hypothetical protein
VADREDDRQRLAAKERLELDPRADPGAMDDRQVDVTCGQALELPGRALAGDLQLEAGSKA